MILLPRPTSFLSKIRGIREKSGGVGAGDEDIKNFGLANLAIFEVGFHVINTKLFELFGFPLLIAFSVQFAACIERPAGNIRMNPGMDSGLVSRKTIESII